MSSATHTPGEALPPRPAMSASGIGCVPACSPSPLSILATVLLAWLVLMAVPALVEWALIGANFTATSAQECRQSEGPAGPSSSRSIG